MSNEEWKKDLNPEAVHREAVANVKPRVTLPDVGQNITVVFQSEPRLIPSGATSLGRDLFVADVDDGSGIPKQIICTKSIRQHLAAMEERGDLKQITGAQVNISAQILPQFITTDGRILYNAKVYNVFLLNPQKIGAAQPLAQALWDIPDPIYQEIQDMGPLADNTDWGPMPEDED